MLGVAETGDLHDIHGTGFQVLRLAVLPEHANPLVVVNTEAISRLVAVPQKIMEGDDGQGRVSALKFQRLDHTVDIFRGGQGRCTLQKDEDIRFVTVGLPQKVECVQ